MPLTKLPAGSIVDGSITSSKIADATITATDIANSTITVDKLSSTLDISTRTLTLPVDAVTHRELAITYTSPTHDDKFLQINSSGEFVWADPGSYPITYSAITGPIPAGHIAAGTIVSSMIGNQEVAEANIADGTITDGKLSTTLDLSTKTITYPTDTTVTNLTVTGNLKTEGTTTEVDTQNLLVKDNIIRINDDETGPGVSANAAGIEIFRGPGQDHATIMWDEASGKFEFRLGASTVDLTFGAAGTPADSIGYDQLKINDAADPGPATNTFLQSAGDGNFEFAVVNSANFPVSGAISGTLTNNTLQNYSVTTQKIADKAITSAKFDTSISFVGTTVILNPGDILTAINGAGYFNLTNPNINLPTNVVDSGNIQDGSVTGFKLANTLDLSTKTLTYPNDITFQNLTISGNLTVNGTTTTINTALETSEGLEITPTGSTVGLLINSTSTGHPLQIQDNSVDTFLVKDGGDVVLQSLTIEKNITEKLGTSTVNSASGSGVGAKCTIDGAGLTVDFDPGNHANNDRGSGYAAGDKMESSYKPDNTNGAWIVTVSAVGGSGEILTATVIHNPNCTSHNHSFTLNNVSMENISTSSITVDLATGNHFVVDLESLSGNIETFTVNNTNQEANRVSSFTMKIIQGSTTRQFTWASLTAFKWPGSFGDGSLLDFDPPALTDGADKVDIFSFITYDNGTTWYGQIIGLDYR